MDHLLTIYDSTHSQYSYPGGWFLFWFDYGWFTDLQISLDVHASDCGHIQSTDDIVLIQQHLLQLYDSYHVQLVDNFRAFVGTELRKANTISVDRCGITTLSTRTVTATNEDRLVTTELVTRKVETASRTRTVETPLREAA